MYGLGQGTTQDYVEAHRWYNLSSKQGNPEALKAKNALAGLMSDSQIEEAERLAEEFRPKKEIP